MDSEILTVLTQLTTALSSATTLIQKMMTEKPPVRELGCQLSKPLSVSSRRMINVDEQGDFIDLPPTNTKYRGRLEKYS